MSASPSGTPRCRDKWHLLETDRVRMLTRARRYNLALLNDDVVGADAAARLAALGHADNIDALGRRRIFRLSSKIVITPLSPDVCRYR